MVATLPTKYIANREGLRKALANAKRFDRIARATDAPPASLPEVDGDVDADAESVVEEETSPFHA